MRAAKPPPKADALVLSEFCQPLTTRYFSLLTGEILPLRAEHQEDIASVLCFLIPKSLEAHLGFHAHCLSEDDWKEIRKHRTPSRRMSMKAARVVLRFALCMIAKRGSASDWKFVRTKAGKLKIANLDGYGCSISYTKDVNAVAVSRGLDVGLDVESTGLPISKEMAHSFLSKREVAELEDTETARRHDHFLKIWAIKESLVKLSGAGLSEDIKQIDTTKCKNQLYSDGLGTRAMIFASRIAELTGGSERGWLSLALQVPQETSSAHVRLEMYRLTADRLSVEQSDRTLELAAR